MAKHTIVLLIFCTQLIFAEKASSVAILDFFEVKDASKKRHKAMSNIFEVELKAKRVYTIFDRSAIKTLLKEPANKKYNDCDSIQCQIEIGRLIGVDKIITGSLLKFEDFFSLTIEIIEVETGYTEKAFAVEINRTQNSAVIVGCKRGASLVSQYAIVTSPVNIVPQVLITPKIKKEKKRDKPDKLKFETTPTRPHQKSIAAQVGLYTASVVGFGLGAYYDQEVSRTYKTYLEIDPDKPQSQIDTDYTIVQSYELKRNIFLGVGAVFLLAGISYTVFF